MERKFWLLTQNTKEKRKCASLFRPSSRDHLGNDEAPRAGFLGGACPSGGVVGGFSDIGAVVVNGVGARESLARKGIVFASTGAGEPTGRMSSRSSHDNTPAGLALESGVAESTKPSSCIRNHETAPVRARTAPINRAAIDARNAKNPRNSRVLARLWGR